VNSEKLKVNNERIMLNRCCFALSINRQDQKWSGPGLWYTTAVTI